MFWFAGEENFFDNQFLLLFIVFWFLGVLIKSFSHFILTIYIQKIFYLAIWVTHSYTHCIFRGFIDLLFQNFILSCFKLSSTYNCLFKSLILKFFFNTIFIMDSNSDSEVRAHFTRPTTKALTDPKITPVILVCIYNKNSTLISHDLLYNVFSVYGKILRVFPLYHIQLLISPLFSRFSSSKKLKSGKPLLSSPMSVKLWKPSVTSMNSNYLMMVQEWISITPISTLSSSRTTILVALVRVLTRIHSSITPRLHQARRKHPV